MRKTRWLLLIVMAAGMALAGEVPKPKEGMSVDQLIDVWYQIQFTRFARDYTSNNKVILIDRGKARRERQGYRARIILQQHGIDYKDYVAFVSPAAVKGVATLTWSYLDPEKEREQWLYLPSLKKARRTSPANDDDSFMGSVFTVEEITSWRPSYETYKLVGVKKFPGYKSEYDGKTYYAGDDCYLIEAFPRRQTTLRSRRTFWLRKSDGCCLFQEVFDKNGKMYKTLFRSYQLVGPNSYPTQIIIEGKDLRTGDVSIVVNEEIKFDQGLKENIFSVENLQKMKW
ncbi:MAG TPA: outer membrane lipoprotein-sorting protein [bacterium]|nr:outer membrane lipoprotein-sorting protein [bacterium]HOL65844.1 outer membrane lipoprotein-sorting protein [bacterium]HPP11106.1 outer membrane lipoprotein-sorting protein [bacterium]